MYVLGGAADSWGRTWTPAKIGSLAVEVIATACVGNTTIRIDAMQVRVCHQSGGAQGGGGGGGEVSIPNSRHFASVIGAFRGIFDWLKFIFN